MNLRITGLFLFLFAFGRIPMHGRESQATSSAQNPAVSNPNTPEGLQNLIGDILRAAKTRDSAKETELIRGLLMPENSTWFTDEYGPGFGASLAAAYRRAAPQLEGEIKTIYEANVERGWMSPKILRYADPENVNAPIDHFLNCMDQIVPLYTTAFQGSSVSLSMSVKPGGRIQHTAGDLDGYFVFFQAGFRFVPADILMMLPTERPVRIRLEMNVMQSKLLNKVYPNYPQEAIQKNIRGKVVVRLYLGRDGNIQELKSMEGDPILSKAFMEAVKQWRFAATRLDGDPVEVEVDAGMVFN